MSFDHQGGADPFHIRPMLGVVHYLDRRRSVFLCAYIGYAAAYIVRNNFKVVSDSIQRELHWSDSQIGLILMGFTVTYGVGKFVMGIVVDRTRLHVTFAVCLAASAVLCAVMASLPTVSAMFLAMCLLGILQGALAPGALATIGAWYPNRLRAARVAIWNTSQNVGGAALPAGAGAIAAVSGPENWRVAFWLPAAIALVIAGVCYRSGGDRPWRERMPTLTDMYGATGCPQPPVAGHGNYWHVLRTEVLSSRVLLMVATINAMLYLVRFGIINWLPIYLDVDKELDATQIQTAFGVLEGCGVVGSIIFAAIARSLPNRMSSMGMWSMAVLSGAVIWYWAADSFHGTIAASAVLGSMIYGPQVVVNIMTLNLVSIRASGAAVGLVGLGGYLVGELMADTMIPILADTWGWNVDLVIITVVSGICLLLYRRLRAVELSAVPL